MATFDAKNTPQKLHASPAKKDVLGKNRASPTKSGKKAYSPKNKKKKSKALPNREYIRVATASRLMADHWHRTGINLKGSSVQGCGRWKNYISDPNIAQIEVPQDGRLPRMLGHFQCKSLWSCEHCSKVRSAQTRSWIRACFMPALDKRKMSASLLTFTMAHTYTEDWSATTDRLIDAFTLADKKSKKAYALVGSLGKLKAIEATIGSNGLHIHIHALLTHSLSADLFELETTLRGHWEEALKKVGGECNEHGFDLKPNCVNEYVAKMETAHEMSTQGTKEAKTKGKTCAQLLDRAAVGDKKAAEEWIRAQAALGGRMRFHAGNLPKRLEIVCPSEWEDHERNDYNDDVRIATETPDPIVLSYPQRFHLKATGTMAGRSGLAMILRSARKGDIRRVRKIVDALCAEVDRLENPSAKSFYDWPDDFFEKLISEASTRPLTTDEVEAYIFGKSTRGIGVVHPDVAEGVAVIPDFILEDTDVSPSRVGRVGVGC